MKLVSFADGSSARLGALVPDNGVLDLTTAANYLGRDDASYGSMQSLIEGGERAWDGARALIAASPAEAVRQLSATRLLAPLPRPVRMRDCSLFLQHMENALTRMAHNAAQKESDPKAAYERLRVSGHYDLKPIFREQIVYYNCNHLAVSGTGDDIIWPTYSSWMDYELEWACVIGTLARNATPANARRHIFGYTIFNDWSARDVQMPIMEARLGPGEGKDFDRANTLGPCIATPDEFRDPYDLTMIARINGEEWSRGSTSTMHHTFDDAIVQFSREKTLQAGEIIGSGTVLNGCGYELDRKLAADDVVELEIEGIGILRNRVVRG